jgi:iron complex outermembrane recepter protein
MKQFSEGLAGANTRAAGQPPSAALAVTVSLVALLAAPAAYSQDKSADAASPTGATSSGESSASDITEVTVTGSRIARPPGYEAPTPVSVLSAGDLDKQAVSNVADALNRMPEFTNSTITSGSSASFGNTGGAQILNLRGLGGNRTLVLLDGKRFVADNFSDNGAVDSNIVPMNLVQRVDVVTGGASAIYGSDALSGVVNFILDKNFTGIKGNVQGNVTTYGDDPGYQIELAAGEPFADGRGHFLVSAENVLQAGLEHNPRPWAANAYSLLVNPNYAAGNGQPFYISAYNTGSSTATPGGLITTGPLKGTMFGAGGTPSTFTYGNLVSSSIMSGGDWQLSNINRLGSLDLHQERTNFYSRASYDVTDNVTAFVEAGWVNTHAYSLYGVPYFHLGNVTVKSGNPFIPASVQAAMTAQGLTQFTLGTTNADESTGFSADNDRTFQRYVGGLEGKTNLLGTDWSWNLYVTHSQTHAATTVPHDEISANYTLAVDAVTDPKTGRIVCRSTLTAPNNGCVPYNPMGIGVNSQAALNYIQGTGYTMVHVNQDVQEFSATGAPFSLWAGPVALALDFAHRSESTAGDSTALDQATAFFAGNFSESFGHYAVTEGALETDIPLAKDVFLAKALDLNAAVRFTDYSTSGSVETWKVGGTYKPVSDVTFRVTQSRDIRAPSLAELFNSGTSGGTTVNDGSKSTFIVQRTEGNPDLEPETANTTGLGVVFTPTFLPGFGTSIDYYNIKIDGAIVSLSAQNIVNLCNQGNEAFCPGVLRNADGSIGTVLVRPANFQQQSERGIDFETSYNFDLANLASFLPGHVTFRALATYIDSVQTVGNGVATEGAGVLGAGGGIGTSGLNAPRWKYTSSLTYDLNDFEGTVSARGFGSGTYNNILIQCTTNCPVYSTANPTIDNNHIPSWTAIDLNLSYKVLSGDGTFYLTVQNLMNRDPPLIAANVSSGVYAGLGNAAYDQLGRVWRAGFRFKF